MTIGFHSKVGYDAAKDVTFLQTDTADFDEQLTFPTVRGSKEDKSIRALLEEQGVVDFKELNHALHLPSIDEDMTFGVVGGKHDGSLVPWKYEHVVLFGKEGSGALNLIRYWLLWAVENGFDIVSIGNPDDLYGFEPYINPDRLQLLELGTPLREQIDFDAMKRGDVYAKTVFLFGAGYEATSLEDRMTLRDMQNGVFGNEVLSFIHNSDSPWDDFTGSDGDKDRVTLGVIGDVEEHVAAKVGSDVPARNARGIAWFSRNGEEAKRVKTYMVPRDTGISHLGW